MDNLSGIATKLNKSVRTKICAKVPFEKAKSYLYTIANNAFLNEVAHEKVKLKYRQHSSAVTNTLSLSLCHANGFAAL